MTTKEREALDAIRDLLAIAFREIEAIEHGIMMGAHCHDDTRATYDEVLERVVASAMLVGAKVKHLPHGPEICERYFAKLQAEKQRRIAAGEWKPGPDVAAEIIETVLPGNGEE